MAEQAVQDGASATMHAYSPSGLTVGGGGRRGYSALQLAALWNQCALMEWLIDDLGVGVDPNKAGGWRAGAMACRSALAVACRANRPDAVALLMARGADANLAPHHNTQQTHHPIMNQSAHRCTQPTTLTESRYHDP